MSQFQNTDDHKTRMNDVYLQYVSKKLMAKTTVTLIREKIDGSGRDTLLDDFVDDDCVKV